MNFKKKKPVITEKYVEKLYTDYFRISSQFKELDRNHSALQRELDDANDKLFMAGMSDNVQSHLSSLIGSVANLNKQLVDSKQHLGRYYWPPTQYCAN